MTNTHARLSLRYAHAMHEETVQRLRLVGAVPHRGESGRAREEVIKDFLRAITPPGLGIDSGFVVDGLGGVSRQVDVILYQPDYYPVFSIGGVKHFMVEGVKAVFEVKSALGSAGVLRGALENIESVKVLDRSGGGRNYALPSRRPIDPEVYQCQIFGGVITESSLSAERVLDEFEQFLMARPRRQWPNIYIDVPDFALRYREPGEEVTEDPNHASALALSDPLGHGSVPPLVDLAIALADYLRVAAWVDYNPSNYFKSSDTQAVIRPLSDDRYPGRVQATERLPPGTLSQPPAPLPNY